MKIIYTLLALLVLAALFYFFVMNGGTQEPAINDLGTEDAADMTTDTETDETADEADITDASDSDAEMTGDEMSTTSGSAADTAMDKGGEEANEVVIDLDGFNFDYSQDEIRVQEGDTVTINLTSTDGFHDWVVDEFDASTERVQTGETASVTFVADTAGSYEFYCSVGNHREMGMVGTLIVE